MRACWAIVLIACGRDAPPPPPAPSPPLHAPSPPPAPVPRPRAHKLPPELQPTMRDVSIDEALAFIGVRGTVPADYTARITGTATPVVQLDGDGPMIQLSRLPADEQATTIEDWVARAAEDPASLEILARHQLANGWIVEYRHRGASATRRDVWGQVRGGTDVILCIGLSDDSGHDQIAVDVCSSLRDR